MRKNRGQITIQLLAAGAMIIAAVSLALSAYTKSDKAIDRVSAVEGNIQRIQSEMKGMNDKLDMLTDYFKLTPKESVKNK